MGTKNNIRSIRFSDKLAELIESQPGRNFTEKLENLVARCVWELPARTSELEQLEERIAEKRKQLQKMTAQAGELNMTVNSLSRQAAELQASIQRAVEKWDV